MAEKAITIIVKKMNFKVDIKFILEEKIELNFYVIILLSYK